MSENQSLQRVEPEPESAVVPYQPLPPPSVFGTADPIEVIKKASEVAAALKQVVVSRGLISKIQGKEYPRCEAWTLLGTMLGIFPVTVWTRPMEGGWEARTEARTLNGTVVGAAEAMCLRSERHWANRDDFALRSMAATRSVAKALRMPLGFVMSLSGFQPTPAEEMDFDRDPAPSGTGKRPGSGKPEPGERGQKPKEAPAVATEEQRQRWINELRKRGDYGLGYCYDKGWLLPESGPDDDRTPGEPLEALSVTHVPTTRKAAEEILAELDMLMPENLRPKSGESTQPPVGASRPPSESAGQDSDASHGNVARSSGGLKHSEPDQQAWFTAIVPVPYKGMKRDEYLKRPDTIGELYNLRHDDDQARRRLFGFVHNFEPKGWTNREGKQMPPSASDKKFRDDLDAFADWFQANHPDEMKD